MQTIRTDRGGEFTSNSLNSFLQHLGIKHIFSPAYTPQFQGKVERLNRTVGEMAHSMRVSAGLGTVFWSLAWETAFF